MSESKMKIALCENHKQRFNHAIKVRGGSEFVADEGKAQMESLVLMAMGTSTRATFCPYTWGLAKIMMVATEEVQTYGIKAGALLQPPGTVKDVEGNAMPSCPICLLNHLARCHDKHCKNRFCLANGQTYDKWCEAAAEESMELLSKLPISTLD